MATFNSPSEPIPTDVRHSHQVGWRTHAVSSTASAGGVVHRHRRRADPARAALLPPGDSPADRRDRDGHRGDGGHRRHHRHRRLRDAVRRLAHRDPGLRLAGQHRGGGVHRFRRRSGQRPRRGAPGVRARAGGDGRRRRHRRAGCHAHQRGDRRPRGDGHQVDQLPGVDAHPRRHRGDRPAIRHGAAAVVPGRAAHHHRVLRAVDRHLRPLLPHVPAARRRVLVLRRRDHHRHLRDDQPLLLRLQRQRRSGRRRRGGGYVDARVAGRGRVGGPVASLALYGTNPNFNLTV